MGQTHLEKQILWTTDWSTDNRYIAFGGNTDSLKIYETKDMKTVMAFPVKNMITNVKWHPTKNILAVVTQSNEGTAFLVEIGSKNRVTLIGISQEGGRGLDWHHSGEYLAVADNDGLISLYDEKGNLLRQIKHENSKSITGIDWHPTKTEFITVGDKIRKYDLNGTLLKTINHRHGEVLLLCVAWHPSGKMFVTGDYGDETNKPWLQYWKEDGQLIKSIDISKSEYRNIRWNKKGKRLASTSDVLRIWDIKGNLLHSGIATNNLWGVSWNSKGNKIVTTSEVKEVVLWSNKAQKLALISQ
ncbi:MAG: WD40 repeat domain-containing protein [Saprospiraceae bacterium]